MKRMLDPQDLPKDSVTSILTLKKLKRIGMIFGQKYKKITKNSDITLKVECINKFKKC